MLQRLFVLLWVSSLLFAAHAPCSVHRLAEHTVMEPIIGPSAENAALVQNADLCPSEAFFEWSETEEDGDEQGKMKAIMQVALSAVPQRVPVKSHAVAECLRLSNLPADKQVPTEAEGHGRGE